MNAPDGVSDFARLCWRVVLWVSIVIGVAILLAWPVMADVPPEPKAEATVKVTTLAGHGSGFHIGGGIIVTAAHVVGTQASVSIISSFGSSRAGTVVYYDTVNDIAVVRLEHYADLSKAILACRVAVRGEDIEVRGNPGAFDFVSAWGRIAGDPREVQGYWRVAIPINITIAGGFSGGAVFDHTGKVIGIAVGIALQRGRDYIGLAVPATLVCQARDMLGLS